MLRTAKYFEHQMLVLFKKMKIHKLFNIKKDMFTQILTVAGILLILYIIYRIFTRLNIYNGYKLETFQDSNSGKQFAYYYMNGCGHCDKFSPIWNQFSNNYSGPLQLKKIERAAAGDDLEKYNIKGFPSIILIENGTKIKEFDDERTLEALQNFANANK
jgi:thiol-disulfide isomerase/thioredoxin